MKVTQHALSTVDVIVKFVQFDKPLTDDQLDELITQVEDQYSNRNNIIATKGIIYEYSDTPTMAFCRTNHDDLQSCDQRWFVFR